MDGIFRKIWIILAFALAACTSPGGSPLGGGSLTGALDATAPGMGVQGADGTGLDDTAHAPDRQGSKIDLDPGGDYKYLFLARDTMIGTQPNLYDPDKCQKFMDCTVFYLSCEDFQNLTVTWGDNPHQCHIAEWTGIAYKPDITELDCRHMLPCTPLAPGGPDPSAFEDEAANEPKHFLFCTKEYTEGKTIQEGDQCRLPSWPETSWMECEAFETYCEAMAPKVVKIVEESEGHEESLFKEFQTDEPLQQQHPVQNLYPKADLP